MLSNIDIDNLIQPFVDRQKMIEVYIVNLIAKRVKQIGRLLPSDIYKLERLYQMGADVKSINRMIAQVSGLQEKEIKKLIRYVAADAYAEAKPYYDYRQLSYIPIAENIALQKIIYAVSEQTQKSFKNLSNSTMIGFTLRDLRNPKKTKFYNAEQTYKTIIDEAVQAAQSGVIDYNTAIRRTMKQLGSSGLKTVTYESGYKQRMDTAVIRNILDGIRQINQKVMDFVGRQFGSNGYELTAHYNPAPDHAPFQGHIFTARQYARLQANKRFKDINGKRFPAQKRIIGQWNCKHFAYPIVLDGVVPTYTQEQLDKILEDNNRGMTLPNGKHLTGYEATQHQNKLALEVRKAKEAQMIAEQAGDEELAKQLQAKVNQKTKEYNAFNKLAKEQMNLSPRKDKLTVAGYKKISTK